LIRLLDYAQIFIGVFEGCLSWHHNEIACRRLQQLVGPDHLPDQSTNSEGTKLLIRPFDHAQIFTGVYRSCFPWHWEFATQCMTTFGLVVLIQPLDCAQTITWVCGGSFLWRRKEIANRRRWWLVGPDHRPSQSTYQLAQNSWSNRWIMLKFSQEFVEAVFHGVAMTLLIDAYDVWSGQTIYQTRVTAPQFHNSWSDRCITLKSL